MGHRNAKVLLAGAAALALAVMGGMAWAGGGPEITAVELSPVWGGVYKLSARVESARGAITAAEYRIGPEDGPLFAVDGLFDSREEEVEAYVDLGAGHGPLEVRARAGGAWSDWHEVDGPGLGPVVGAGCTVTSDAPGTGGWHRGPVTVDCSGLLAAEGGDLVAYSLGFGDWLESEDGTFVVREEGVHWVQVESRTVDGATGLPASFTVSIDGTAPRVRLQAPPSQELTHADTLVFSFEADDELSGVAFAAAEVDQELELQDGAPLELWQLPLGYHTLTAVARDQAGNTATLGEPRELYVTVDIPSLSRLVRQLSARGRVDGYTGLRQQLIGQLEAAGEAQAAGEELEAMGHLEAFVESVQDGVAQGLIMEDAGDVLAADGRYLIGQLDGDLGWE